SEDDMPTTRSSSPKTATNCPSGKTRRCPPSCSGLQGHVSGYTRRHKSPIAAKSFGVVLRRRIAESVAAIARVVPCGRGAIYRKLRSEVLLCTPRLLAGAVACNGNGDRRKTFGLPRKDCNRDRRVVGHRLRDRQGVRAAR